ncbi:STAS domain-containing protein [Streptomyces goshikiensis]|uniref:STAS domain-containing protein n=1 Tax=Streptomyces goshikiensis TaxID=1942 RepID=UPI0036B4467B
MDGYGTASGGDGPRFTVDVRWSGRTAVVAVAGELDHDHAEPLREAISGALEQGAERIVVDCEHLAFCDSTGLNILLRGRLEARETGSSVELAALGPTVARMFDITGAKAVFTVYPELPEDLADRNRP